VAIGVERIGKLIDEAIEQARTMARGLYPVKLESDGFMAALEDLAMRSQQLFKVPCSFECVQTIRVNDNNAAVHLFRIAQEAVTNAAKHAHASRIQIRLVEEDARLTLSVEDDGCGMPEQAGSPTGMGLRIMHYRARMIDGDLQIRSAPEGGTIVRCSWRPN
jgi:signal transduction histidine kinase